MESPLTRAQLEKDPLRFVALLGPQPRDFRWTLFAFSFIHRGQMAMPSDDSANSSAPALPASQVFSQMNTLGAFLLEVLN